jgi:hypothetical protein
MNSGANYKPKARATSRGVVVKEAGGKPASRRTETPSKADHPGASQHNMTKLMCPTLLDVNYPDRVGLFPVPHESQVEHSTSSLPPNDFPERPSAGATRYRAPMPRHTAERIDPGGTGAEATALGCVITAAGPTSADAVAAVARVAR